MVFLEEKIIHKTSLAHIISYTNNIQLDATLRDIFIVGIQFPSVNTKLYDLSIHFSSTIDSHQL